MRLGWPHHEPDPAGRELHELEVKHAEALDRVEEALSTASVEVDRADRLLADYARAEARRKRTP